MDSDSPSIEARSPLQIETDLRGNAFDVGWKLGFRIGILGGVTTFLCLIALFHHTFHI